MLLVWVRSGRSHGSSKLLEFLLTGFCSFLLLLVGSFL